MKLFAELLLVCALSLEIIAILYMGDGTEIAFKMMLMVIGLWLGSISLRLLSKF